MSKNIFRKIKNVILSHDLFLKLFSTLFLCIIIPVAITCIISYAQTEALIREQAEQSATAYLSSLGTRIESAIQAQKMQMMDYSLKEALSADFNSSKAAKEATALLINAYNTNDNLMAAFVLDSESNCVISNLGYFDAETYFSKHCILSQLTFDEINSTLRNNRSFSIYGAIDFLDRTKSYQPSQTACLLLYTYFVEHPYGKTLTMGFCSL